MSADFTTLDELRKDHERLQAVVKAVAKMRKERQNIVNDRLGPEQHAFALGHLSACDYIDAAMKQPAE